MRLSREKINQGAPPKLLLLGWVLQQHDYETAL
jgi:hypothetical protein